MRFLIFIIVVVASVSTPAVAASEGLFTKAKDAVEHLILLRTSLNGSYQTYVNAQSAIIDTQEKLAPLELTINTLAEQIRVFDEHIVRTEERTRTLQRELAGLTASLADLTDIDAARAVENDRARRALDAFIRLAYADRMRYTDWHTGEISTVRFLLAGGTLAASDMRDRFLTILAGVSADLVTQLRDTETRYRETHRTLVETRGRYVTLANESQRELAELDDMRAAKDALLTESRGKEAEYKKLMEQAAADQDAALREVADLKDQMSVINNKLTRIQKASKGDDKMEELLRSYGVGGNGLTFAHHIPRLVWAIDPSLGITAYFNDPSYKEMFGVAHQAIDIRAPQGALVRAAAPGVVLATHENGNRYAYIIVAHPGELMTVYGHISKILIKKGDEVQAGDVIGLSGATPGTHGAGLMTTGPHLHFEVIEKGEHHDPLEYLPLEAMRKEDIPDRFLK